MTYQVPILPVIPTNNDPNVSNWVLPECTCTEDDLRKKFHDMEIKFQGIWKSKDSLELSFQDYKQQTAECITRIRDMEKHLREMDKAMKCFEKSKDLFGEELVKNVDDLRSDVDQLKHQQNEDTKSFATFEEKQSIQDKCISDTQRQLNQLKVLILDLNSNQTKKSEELEKRVETLESKEVSKRKLCKRWSLPLSYQLHVVNSDQPAPSNHPPTGQKLQRRHSFRSLSRKKNSSISTSMTSNTLPRRDLRQNTLSFDSIHTKKMLSTSTPDVTPNRKEHREESGYFSPPYTPMETTDESEAVEHNGSFFSRKKRRSQKTNK